MSSSITTTNDQSRISKLSRISLYVLIYLMAFYLIIVMYWQVQVVRGRAMNNPDGSVDDYHEQKIFYGIAIADFVVPLPLMIAAFAFWYAGDVSIAHLLFAMVSFWFVYWNTVTTATSLRFETPTIDTMWIITCPFGIVLGFLYWCWIFIHYDDIFHQSSRGDRGSYTAITNEWWQSASGW